MVVQLLYIQITAAMDNLRVTDIPEHVSWRVIDAWLCIPPCNYSNPYCHVDCPYFYECNPPEEEDSDSELWDEYFSNK